MTQRTYGLISAWVGMIMMLLSLVVVMARPLQGVPPAPKVAIITVPPYDPVGGPDKTAPIAGTVTAMGDCSDCRIVIFAHTDLWYVQPFVSSPYTTIEGGRWHTITHLGADYTALLVHAAYRPPATTDALPGAGKEVLATATVPGRK
jgi:hypothetical protein